jgi:hypothetical protein
MGRAWRAVAASMLVVSFAAGACSDDDDDSDAADEVVTEDDYANAVAQICEQHRPRLEAEVADVSGDGASDADIVAFYRVDYIPRVRASLQNLVDQGLPTDRAADLLAVYNEINAQLVSLERDPYGYIDRTRNGDPSNEGTLETFATAVNEDLTAANIDCLPATNLA